MEKWRNREEENDVMGEGERGREKETERRRREILKGEGQKKSGEDETQRRLQDS